MTGLIDPATSRWDTVTADLSRLLGSLVGDEPEAWRIAIAAYESQRPLSAAERDLLPVLDRSGVVLSAGTWIQRLLAGNAPIGPNLLARLRSIASRLETLRVEG